MNKATVKNINGDAVVFLNDKQVEVFSKYEDYAFYEAHKLETYINNYFLIPKDIKILLAKISGILESEEDKIG